MENKLVAQGRSLSPQDIDFLSQLNTENPSWSRRRHLIKLCQIWTWRNTNGQLAQLTKENQLLKA